MKVSFKFATGLVLAAVLVAGTNPAQAGEGGAAGSVSIRFAGTTGALVDRLSSSVAVGTGGTLQVSGINDAIVNYAVTGETATGLGVGQGNSFASAPSLQIIPGPTTGVTLL